MQNIKKKSNSRTSSRTLKKLLASYLNWHFIHAGFPWSTCIGYFIVFKNWIKVLSINFLVNKFIRTLVQWTSVAFVSWKLFRKRLKFKFPAQVQKILGWRGLFGAGSTSSHFIRYTTLRASHYVDHYCIHFRYFFSLSQYYNFNPREIYLAFFPPSTCLQWIFNSGGFHPF